MLMKQKWFGAIKREIDRATMCDQLRGKERQSKMRRGDRKVC